MKTRSTIALCGYAEIGLPLVGGVCDAIVPFRFGQSPSDMRRKRCKNPAQCIHEIFVDPLEPIPPGEEDGPISEFTWRCALHAEGLLEDSDLAVDSRFF